MKRFSKILTLILALVTILTAFTVVALAEVEGGSAKSQPALDYEGTTAGTTVSTTFFYKEDYPGGNKYLVYDNSVNGQGKTIDHTPSGVSSNSSKHRVKDWPIIAYDFDFMTPTGHLGYRDKVNNSAGLTPRPYYYAVNNNGRFEASNYWSKITFKAMGLSNEKYLWQHVTLIYVWEGENFTYNDVTSSNFYSVYASVNGAEPIHISTTDCTSLFSKYTNTGKEGETVLGRIFFYQGNYGTSNSYPDYGGYQYIDNFTASYFSAEYKSDLTAVSNYVFDDEYKATTFPTYKFTVATVTVGEGEEAVVNYFDDIAKALEFAKDNDGRFSLAGDITSPYCVDRELTIDARKVDAEGNYTGEVYAGVVENAITTTGYYVVATETPGVYKSVKGDFMVSQSDGSWKAYPANEFTDRIFKANSATLKLLSDIEVDAVFTVNKTNYTIDLNGYSLKRISYYGNVYNAEGEGEFVKADTGISNKGSTLFALNYASGAHSYGFLITSSNGRGTIYNINANSNTYYRDGVMVSREILSYQPTYLLYTSASYSEPGNKFSFENFDHYGSNVLTADYNGRKNLNFEFDNIRHYQMGSYASNNAQSAFYLSANNGFTLNVTNSQFYFNDHAENMTSGLIRLVEALAADSYVTDINFVNCDIISNDDGADYVGIMSNQSADSIELINCRTYNLESYNNVRSSEGTIANSYYDSYKQKYLYHIPTALDGWTNKTLAQSITKTYTVPAVDAWAKTTDAIQSVDINIETKEYVCTYTKITTKEMEITVGDKSATLIPGVSDIYAEKALRVYAEENDVLLNKIYLLADASGNVYDKYLGIIDGKFVFDWDNATLSASEETKFVGGIEYANFNLNFLTGFRYNLYIPVDARLTDVAVEGYAKSETTVLIGGEEYTVWYKTVGTAAAAEANTISATFNVDGEEYSQTWSINAIAYAGLLLDQSSDLYPNEAAAIGAMAKFIKEAVALTDGSTADVAAIDAIITKSDVATTYGDYTEGDVDALNGLNGAVTGAQYLVYNGVAAYKFTVAAEDTEISFTVNGENVDFTRGSETDGETTVYYVILEPMRVYDLIDTLTITSGEDSVDFTMVDYLTKLNGAENINLAKALYEFGLAADEYKKDIMKAAK